MKYCKKIHAHVIAAGLRLLNYFLASCNRSSQWFLEIMVLWKVENLRVGGINNDCSLCYAMITETAHVKLTSSPNKVRLNVQLMAELAVTGCTPDRQITSLH